MFVRHVLLSGVICVLCAGILHGDVHNAVSVENRVTVPAHLAPVYGAMGALDATEAAASTEKMNLRPAPTASPGMVIGITYYDIQHNSTMGRQVEHRGGDYLYFDWTHKTDNILGGARYVMLSRFDLKECQMDLGNAVNTNRAGYCALDVLVHDNGYAIPAAHESNAGTNPTAYWNADYPLGNNANFVPEYIPSNFIWPKIDWDSDGNEFVLHLVAIRPAPATGDPTPFIYYRRLGPYGAGAGVWSSGRMVDTGMNLNITVTSSPISDKVALVWNAPADYRRDTPSEWDSQYENDVWFAVATDNGAAWAINSGNSIGSTVDLGIGAGYNPLVGGNLTTYPSDNMYRAYCDLSALWTVKDTPDDYLQIVWGCREWGDATTLFRRNSAMFHWSQKTDAITTVAVADWDVGGACYADAWASDIAKMTISECDGRLYIVYTQFGSPEAPCSDIDSRNQQLNGEIYITMSDDDGVTWDTPTNLTNSPTPSCDSAYCDSDYWASAARYGRYDGCSDPNRYVLDILYINDKSPGTCVQGVSGIWTANNVMWLPTPCYGSELCGDVNDDDAINIADAVFLVQYIFQGGSAPDPLCGGDATNDGNINVGDAVAIISYVFSGGPQPGPECCAD